MPDRPANRLFAALYDPVTAVVERSLFAPHRRALADGLSGRVLDLGSGTGAMFPYYAETAAAPSVVALEPDPHMRRRAQQRAAEVGLDAAFVDGDAGALPFADDTFDAAVAAVVLCTVPDLGAALDELARVLAPGGELRVFEHVHGTGWYGQLQDAATPAWRAVAAGCHLNRATGDRLAAHPGLEVVEVDRYRPIVPPVTPFVRMRLRALEG